jgi:phosphatidate phosphatase APP1
MRKLKRVAPFVLLSALGLILGNALAWPFETGLKSDEIVQFQDSYAIEKPNGSAEVRVHAWVYEREPRRGALSLFANYLDLDLDQLDAQTRIRFEQRARLFFVDTQANKRLSVSLEQQSMELPKTNGFGVTLGLLKDAQPPVDAEHWLRFHSRGPETRFDGRAQLVPIYGVSVVSDIDDTIRDTNVLDTKEMLQNTFVRETRALPQMAPSYRQFLQHNPSARMHYLSNSPFALDPLLKDFLVQNGFPEGSMHLRAVSLRSSVLDKIRSQHSTHKREVIEQLLHDFPKRQFILIGDTGERDPEIYADILRRHRSRISQVLLHHVQADSQASRLGKLYANDAALTVFKRGQMPNLASLLTLKQQ